MGDNKIPTIAMVVFLLSFFILPDSGRAKYSGGSGTSDDPYQIGSAEDLLALAADTDDYGKNFALIADIDIDPNLPSGQVFTTAVIACDTDNSNYVFEGVAFTGIFDGMGHKITKLTIDTNGVGNDYLGLFGDIDGGEVKNLMLENVSIIGGLSSYSYYLGGLVGENFYGTISNCSSTGTVTGGDNSGYLGGLVGISDFGTIDNCFSTGAVTGGNYSYSLGGLVGAHYSGTIDNCFSTGAVAGGNDSDSLGGLVGENHDSISNCFSTGAVTGGGYSEYLGGLAGWNIDGTVSNCFSTGEVTGDDESGYLGGLVGDHFYGDISDCYSTGAVTGGDYSEYLGGLAGENFVGTVSNCFSTGAVTGGDGSSYLGGLAGYESSGSISDCYFLDVAGPNNGLGTPLTDTQMKQQGSFVDWDFNDIWHICEGTNYPKFIWQLLPADFLCPDGVTFVDFSFLAEHWLQTDYGDVNGLELTGNGRVDLGEFAILANWWEQIDCGDCGGADYSDDGSVDLADLDVLCDNWLATDYGDVEGAELTGDGVVDIADLEVLCNYWLEGL